MLSPPRLRMDVVRDQALAFGVITIILSFLSAQRRPQAGRICFRRWLTALQQPSLWGACGWHCPDSQRVASDPSAASGAAAPRHSARLWLRLAAALPLPRRLELIDSGWGNSAIPTFVRR